MMVFIKLTHLDDNGDAYAEDQHRTELGINKSLLISFQQTILLLRHRSYTPMEIISILLHVVMIIGNHDTVARHRVYDKEDKEVQYIRRLKDLMVRSLYKICNVKIGFSCNLPKLLI